MLVMLRLTLTALTLIISVLILSPSKAADGDIDYLISHTFENILTLGPSMVDRELALLSTDRYEISHVDKKRLEKQLLVKFHPTLVKDALKKTLYEFYIEQDNLTRYILFLKSDLNLSSQESYRKSLKKKNLTELLTYQQKLQGKNAKSEREKLINVYNELNSISALQSELMAIIQLTIYNALSKEDKIQYQKPNFDTLYKTINQYNQSIYLYNFRYTPTEKLIEHIDQLYQHNTLLNQQHQLFKKLLMKRAQLNIKINGSIDKSKQPIYRIDN